MLMKFSREDVVHFEKAGVSGVLVGESLMRATSPANKIKELKGEKVTLVKICGIKDVSAAIATAEAGADMIGLVFAESRRKVTVDQAREIASALEKWRVAQGQPSPTTDTEVCTSPLLHWALTCAHHPQLLNENDAESSEWFSGWASKLVSGVERRRPIIVGVFADNDVRPTHVNYQRAVNFTLPPRHK